MISMKASAISEMLSQNKDEFSFLSEYYAKGNGNLVLLTGKRLVCAVGTARSLFFRADSDLFGQFVRFEEKDESLTVCCYAEKERSDDAVRSSVTFVVTASKDGLRISITALHDMKITCQRAKGVRCEAIGEGRYRLTSAQSEVLYVRSEGSVSLDPQTESLSVYAGRSTLFLSFPSSGQVTPRKETSHEGLVLSAFSGNGGGLLALGRRVSLSAYVGLLSYAINRRDAASATSRVRFLEGLYEKYRALPSSFLGDGSEGELPPSLTMTEETILVLSRYVKTFGIPLCHALVEMVAEALTLPLSCHAIREALFLVGDRIGKASRLRAVRRADCPVRRKDL